MVASRDEDLVEAAEFEKRKRFWSQAWIVIELNAVGVVHC